MPGLLETPAPEARSDLGFSVANQKVKLNIDLFSRRIEGHTELEIIPHSGDLKLVRLNCRQTKIKLVKFSQRGTVCTPFSYSDPYALLNLPYHTTAHQHHLVRDRVEQHLGTPPPAGLEITIPRSVKIVDQASTIFVNGTHKGEAGNEQSFSTRYAPITIYIDFVIEKVRDGLHFVGWDQDDLRYPHAYTQNAAPGAMSCLFPCVDSLDSRCTWDITIKTARTLGDALQPHAEDRNASRASAKLRGISVEDKALDLLVACSGDLTDEIIDPHDSTRKSTTFQCIKPVSVRHIGFAVGPFEEVNLAAFRESDEDDRLGRSAVPVHGFCLPGRAPEVRNTCFPLAKAMDYIVTECTQFPFNSFKLCFVDEMLVDHYETASLAICCNRILFSEEIIDPLYSVTRELVFALASQWSGISLAPSEAVDQWATIGIAYFLTDGFLRKLFGNNEYRFQQKIAAQRVCELDVTLPSIYESGSYVLLDRSYSEFIALKAPVVLFILDRRLTKVSASSGVSRIISRMFRDAKIGENETLSTNQLLKMCEKVGHAKLESFFDQWIYGVGCPKFRVTQRFNKKRLVVEMTIVQEQDVVTSEKDKDIEPSMFLRELKENSRQIFAPPPPPYFTGPMTIRIHEADGTPYEHIVEIKDGNTKFDIPYNTKYKRLKRSRRQKERVVPGAAEEGAVEAQEDMLLYSLGDILNTDEEKRDWRLTDWSKEDLDKMNQESYEWIRMDADFEWICQLTINMPGYMYVSQLQQDRDVVAQLETVQYLAAQRTHPLIPTILVRTLLDPRYFHGIRTEAAIALKNHATGTNGGLGFFHLQKAFQELFCFGDSQMIQPNDFSDRAMYYIQKAIPRAIAGIRDAAGRAPFATRKFLYETLRYNDNGDNEFSDCYYLATLMSGLADAVASAPLQTSEDIMMADDGDDYDFFKSCLDEIERYRRRDEWIPTHHNVLTTAALESRHLLAKSGCVLKNPVEFLQYAQQGTYEDVRIAALAHLFNLGYGRADAFITFFFSTLATETSPYVRSGLLQLLGRFLGLVAVGEYDGNKSELEEPLAEPDTLVIEQEASTEARKAKLERKTTIKGAIKGLKEDLSSNETLRKVIWDSVLSQELTFAEIEDLLLICSHLYEFDDSMIVSLKLPRYPVISGVDKSKKGSIVIKFKAGPVRTKKAPPRWQPYSHRPPVPKRDSSNSKPEAPVRSKPIIKFRQNSVVVSTANPPVSTPPPVGTPRIIGDGKVRLKLKVTGSRPNGAGSPSAGARTPR